MKKIYSIANLLIICSVVLSLSSCDPGTDYKKIIENQSSKNIKLLIDKNYNGSKIDTILINAGSNYVVEVSSRLGYREKDYSDCNRGFPLSYINPLNSSKVNISNSSDWIYEHSQKGRGHSVKCIYVIKDESFSK